VDLVTANAKQVAANVATVRRRIAAAGGADRVRLVGMTKGFDADAARAAVAAGLVDLGESYAQELVAKAPALEGVEVRWHFVGHVQTNKVRALAPHVALWQSVDRAVLGDELAKRAPGAAVLVQVNVSGNPAQSGCRPVEVAQLVSRLRRAELDVRGLMAIGAVGGPDVVRRGFRELARIARAVGVDELSMGMSDDLELAIEEGSTMVRIGRALFGDRPPIR
jgi:pyridoxal phosphate enzyme (YggS family)